MQLYSTLKFNNDFYHLIRVKLEYFYERAKQKERFKNLINFVFCEENMIYALRKIKNYAGEDLNNLNLKNFNKIKRLSYNNVFDFMTSVKNDFLLLKKNDNKIIILQQMIYNLLESIYEAYSPQQAVYSGRPEINKLDAIQKIYRCNRHAHWIAKINLNEIKMNISCNLIMRGLWKIGIRDSKLRKLIKIILSLTNFQDDLPFNNILLNITLLELDSCIYDGWDNLKKLLKRTSDNFSLRHSLRRFDERKISAHTGRFIIKRKPCTRTKKGYITIKYKELRAINTIRSFSIRYDNEIFCCCERKIDAEKSIYKITNWLKRNNIKCDLETKITNNTYRKVKFLSYNIGLNNTISLYTVEPKEWLKIKKYVKELAKKIKNNSITIFKYNKEITKIASYFCYLHDYYNSMHYLDTIVFHTLRNSNTWKRKYVRKFKKNYTYNDIKLEDLKGLHWYNSKNQILINFNDFQSIGDKKFSKKHPVDRRILYQDLSKSKIDLNYIFETDWYKSEKKY